jgi:conjugative transfer signal peptidase TraF
MTPSVPVGIWWIHTGAISRGEYVKACLPQKIANVGIARGYLSRGSCSPEKVVPVIKRVIALPGDVVVVDANEVRVNGVSIPISRRRRLDSGGRPIPSSVHLGTSVVPADRVWLFGEIPLSWDSRYYGAIPMSSIRGVAVPLLVLPP